MMKNFLTTFSTLCLLAVGVPSASAQDGQNIIPAKSTLKYRTYFGECPSRVAGALTILLVKEFDANRSLRRLKKLIISGNLVEKHYLSHYQIDYDPMRELLKLEFDCPQPLMKVQIYKSNGLETYDAILVSSGQLFDPTYEELLKSEKKLTQELPFLAIPVGALSEDVQKQLTELILAMKIGLRKKLSEIIYSENKELTIILSINGQPSSVFMGTVEWRDKIDKLDRIVSYMEDKNKMPAIINLTNAKKIVVKFNDKL